MDNSAVPSEYETVDAVTETKLDHLVVAAANLEAGRAYVEELLGAATEPGGRHEAMGSHNRLLRLGTDQYLEIIAVDPDSGPPQRPRWFALDEPAMRARIQAGPVLVTWVVRTGAIRQAAAQPPYDGFEINAMQRGALRWRMTFTPDGGLVEQGLLPLLIEWQGEMPPARLPGSGCALRRLTLRSPNAGRVRATVQALGLADVEVEPAGAAELAAVISTPSRGEVVLSSRSEAA